MDYTKESGICKYCGTAFITEKIINSFNITNNFSNFTVNIHTNSDENLFEVDVHKLVSYKGQNKIVEVSNHITTIGEKAFYGNNNIEKIILPDSVMAIESWAISNCINLKEIAIPNSVTTIYSIAFSNCNIGLQVFEKYNKTVVLSLYIFILSFGLKWALSEKSCELLY